MQKVLPFFCLYGSYVSGVLHEVEMFDYLERKTHLRQVVVVAAHTFNPSTWKAEAGGFLSLRSAWSTARAIQRNPILKKKKHTNKQKNSHLPFETGSHYSLS
jgi:hypothetical protein